MTETRLIDLCSELLHISEDSLRLARAHAYSYIMARAQDEERELRAELGVGEDDQSLLDSMLSDETHEHASG